MFPLGMPVLAFLLTYAPQSVGMEELLLLRLVTMDLRVTHLLMLFKIVYLLVKELIPNGSV